MIEGPIVCNTGPLIALTMVGHLDLLARLYRRVLIPEAVFREIVGSGVERIGSTEVASADWLEHVSGDLPVEPLLAKELGPGESEVIAAAHHLGARLVLIDERRARRIAEQAYGLRVKGSAGILVAAKRAGIIPAVHPLLERMRTLGYHLSQRLIDRALVEAGEEQPVVRPYPPL
jgi:predicted nucleic acid-binding protein